MARVGVFGGTFDPPHVGHLVVAQDVLDTLGLDRLILVPAAEPPHKDRTTEAPAETRARMLEAAVAGESRFEVSRLEIERGGPSFTVDTLRELSEQRPEAEFHLVIGVDQLETFLSWKEPEEVARLARLAVMTRDGRDPREAAPHMDLPYQAVPVTRIDLSSTEIRRRIAAGRSIRHRVPEAVLGIIEAKRLYLRGGQLPNAGPESVDQ